jgi:hypothetical protein
LYEYESFNQVGRIAGFMQCNAWLWKGQKHGSIYGTVTDFATGDPVGNANVRLNPRGETTLTGSDGTFQFNDVTDGNYSLSLSKNGYVDLDDDYNIIEIENGNSVRRDVLLSSQFQSFKIIVNGIEADTLDSGINISTMTFLVMNDGTTDIDLHISTSDSRIKIYHDYYYYSLNGFDVQHLKPNEVYTAVVSLWDDFYTIGYVYVTSGTISKWLVVKGY